MAKTKSNDLQMDLFAVLEQTIDTKLELVASLEDNIDSSDDFEKQALDDLNRLPLTTSGSLLTDHIDHILLGVENDRRSTNSIGGSEESNAISSDPNTPDLTRLQPERAENSGSLGIPTARTSDRDGEAVRNKATNENTRATNVGRTDIDTGYSSKTAATGHDGNGNTPSERNRDTADTLVSASQIESSNYQISTSDQLGTGGAKTKFKNNIVALTLLKQLQTEDRQATREEQSLLVKYVGWGGLAQAFDSQNPDWSNEYNELVQLLPKEEYEKARRSTQDSHYTPTAVINGIYKGLERAGFTGGRILEPSSGTGHFIGLAPEVIAKNSQFTCIELDPLTSDIAKQLYPKSFHLNKGLQDTNLPKYGFDAVVGNPPFGSQKLNDFANPEISKFSIHNYFMAKSVESLKAGAIAAFVVSKHFMDSSNSEAREHIAGQAHFLGGIRLPYNAFKSAGTDVTTDIIFLQKALENEVINKKWVEASFTIDKMGEKIPLNHYFLNNPDQMIGRMEITNKGRVGRSDCVLDDLSIDLETAINERLTVIPVNCYKDKKAEYEATFSTEDVIDLSVNKPIISHDAIDTDLVKIGSFFITPDNKIAIRDVDGLVNVGYNYHIAKNNTEELRIRGLIKIRDAIYTLISNEQQESTSDSKLNSLRATLNTLYDEYVKKYDFLNAQVNRSAFVNDPSFALLQSLEKDYDKGISKAIAAKTGELQRSASANKADIFNKRVLVPKSVVTHVDNALDALAVAMNETGRVDIEFMSRLMAKPFEEFKQDLQGLIYPIPRTDTYETKEMYLTGNVKEKLAIAREAGAEENIRALEAVQPADIDPIDIAVQINSSWLPKEDLGKFTEFLLGESVHFNYSFQPSIGRWIGDISGGSEIANISTWGTEDYHANELMNAILTNTSIKVNDLVGKDDFGKPIYKLNPDKTAAADQKANEIKQAFQDWIWENDERRDRLAKLYNDKFNTSIPRKYDGSHLKLNSLSQGISLRPHQKDAIWRGIQEGIALFDHVVGAGKTMVCIGTMIEQKRMGLVNKPMVVVPNHLLLQWKDEIYKMYPSAKVLIAGKEDFTKDKREKLFARIAVGDWDAVIVGHSSFKKIAMPPVILKKILNEQVDDITTAISVLEYENGNKITIKQLEQLKERFQARLAKKSDQTEKDKVVTFDQLGIDCLMVDESQEFKNLYIPTAMTNVAGLGNLAGSDKAFDLFVKARYLQEKNDGKGLYFATGTSVSNTIAEVFTLQRYMQYNTLKKQGIHHFDSWASTFGQVVRGWELDATGVNYKMNNRFSKFQNVPELMSMYRSFADVISSTDLHNQAQERGERFPTPKIKGGKPQNIIVERTEEQKDYMGYQTQAVDSEGKLVFDKEGLPVKHWNEGSIIYRMENLPKDPREDNPLKITNDARKTGLDFRLIDPEAPDNKQTKVNTAVENIYRIWQENNHRKGTQLVFCDLSTPKSKGKVKEKHYEILDGKTTHEFHNNALVPVHRVFLKIDNYLVASGESFISPKDAVDKALEQAINESKNLNRPTKLAPEIENDEKLIEDDVIPMDEVLAGNSNFSVYDDIKTKLIDMGVPANEVRFIHEANTDLQKQKLFTEMNRGEARILLGSTTKMGAGTNVQKKLVALHHLDCPWRPSDLEQREGRIIRQGNEFYQADPDNFEVEILRYSTKQTYDARMWQVIEQKATSIEQFRRGDMLQRVIDDVVGEAANAAEMKAASTGNPLIFAQVQIASELKKIEAVFNSYKRNQHNLQKRIVELEQSPAKWQGAIASYEESIEIRDSNTPADKSDWQITDASGKIYNDKNKDSLKKYLANCFNESKRLNGVTGSSVGSQVSLGSYRGFELIAHIEGFLSKDLHIQLKTPTTRYSPENLVYREDDKFSLNGFVSRCNNYLDTLEKQIEKRQDFIENDRKELLKAKDQLDKPFLQQSYLEALREDSRQVLTELRKTQADTNYKLEWIPKVTSFGMDLGLETTSQKEHIKEKEDVHQDTKGFSLVNAFIRASKESISVVESEEKNITNVNEEKNLEKSIRR